MGTARASLANRSSIPMNRGVTSLGRRTVAEDTERLTVDVSWR